MFEYVDGQLVVRERGSDRLVQMSEAEAMDMVRSGRGRIADQSEIDESNKQEKYGTLGQQALAAAEGVTRGATLGLVEGFGDEEDIRARREVQRDQYPVTGFVSELVPDVAAGVATGGLSALATGAAKVGAKQALKQGVKQTIKAGGRAGAAAALAGESLASGAVSASQQAFDEGREFLHEDLGRDVSNIAVAAGLNLAFAGAGAGVSRLAKGGKAGKKAAKEVAEQVDDVAAKAEREALGEAPATQREAVQEMEEGVLASAEREANRTQAGKEVEDAVRGKTVKQAEPSLSRSAELSRNAETIRQRIVDEMRPAIDRAMKIPGDTQAVDKKLADGLAKHLSRNDAAQVAAANEVSQRAAQLSGELRAEARQYGRELQAIGAERTPEELAQGISPGVVDPSKARAKFRAAPSAKISTQLVDAAKRLANAADGKEAARELDRFRQAMQKNKLALERSKQTAADKVAVDDDLARIEELQEFVRVKLEDVDTFGDFAKMQADYNKTWTNGFFKHIKTFQQALTKQTGIDYEAKPIMEAWEDSIAQVIRNPQSGYRRHVMGMLDTMDDMVANNNRWGSLQKGEVQEMADTVASVRRMFELADETTSAQSRFEALGQVPVVGGPAQAALTGDLVGRFRRLAGAVDHTVERSVDQWFSGSYRRAEKGAESGTGGGFRAGTRQAVRKARKAAERVPRGARRRFMSRTMEEFSRDDGSPVAAYKRHSEQLKDPEKFSRHIEAKTADLGRVSPAAGMRLSAHLWQAREYLLATMPAPVAASMMVPGGYPPSADAIEDWAVRVNAAMNPLQVVERIASGDVRIDELEVLKALDATRPLYEAIQERVLMRLSEDLGNRTLSDQDLFRMSNLFGIPSIDPAFSQQNAAAAATVKQPEQPQGGQGAPVDTSRIEPSNVGRTGATYGTQG